MTSSVLNILTVSILVGWSMYVYFADKHFRKQYNKELERIRKQYEEYRKQYEEYRTYCREHECETCELYRDNQSCITQFILAKERGIL